MTAKPIDLEQVRADYQALTHKFQSTLMATVSADGEPEASYAAYVRHDDDYYIYISELSAHTRNLSANGRACLLFIEDEDKAAHLFARQRVTYHCAAHEVARDTADFEHIMALFEDTFGAFIRQLKAMQDFHLFLLHPERGSFVQGFAKAFAIEGDELATVRHINDIGHREQAKPSRANA
ncbi:MAG: pyridoxamine 5'-phosphate oxidase family protein [Methylomonas sp.]|nr:pyridoxamine 5'-phosphate oxidase family protein [Methylomonas sp.]PPD21693.1 MAG: pyridoxamine 5'-phosphate oxidase [Methylomonas sp.]PPD25758.1 MAG: pyridoxamine 5'-phosphate oxidase [Methylomonas sp.]PPD37005.1 MAG: pyridoxamine 5'-phosphate oxidase [Methylomonas sp.]PPD40675.1 MAG: pyridoxamine 5'-phosphate oxidase [Methylomonas sp.]